MRKRTCFIPALGAAIAVLAAACTDGPTSSAPEFQGPLLAKGGEKGRPPSPGTEDPPIIITFTDESGFNIRSDGRGPYDNAVCGVQATFNASDARLDPDRWKIRPKEDCGGREPRSVRFTLEATSFSPAFPWDGTTQDGGFFKVNEVEVVTVDNGTVPRTVKALVDWCDLRFNPGLDGNTNSVDVTNNGDGTWTVETQPPTRDELGNVVQRNDVAVCLNSDPAGKLYYHLPFEITVELKQ